MNTLKDVSGLPATDLQSLLEVKEPLCVSIYLTTHRVPADARHDALKLKNLLADAHEQLVVLGLRSTVADDVLAPARGLVHDDAFWLHQSEGLVILLTERGMQHGRLPYAVPDTLVVGGRFHLKPLIPMYQEPQSFFLLALSKKQVRAFKGGRESLEQTTVDGLPTDLGEELRAVEYEKSLQFHSGTAGGRAGAGGRRQAMFHGQGMGSDAEKTVLVSGLRKVNRAVQKELRGSTAPLVLAGVDYLVRLYRDVDAYPHTTAESVHGNVDAMDDAELHREAWSIAQATLSAARVRAATRFAEIGDQSHSRKSSDLEEVLAAVEEGRVEILFLASNDFRWGRWDGGRRVATVHDQPQPGDEDLLDRAAVGVLATGGAVHVVDSAEVPGGAPLAAVFRY